MGGHRHTQVLFAMMFVAIFTIGPTAGTIGVFITPLIKYFGWDHAQVSRIATAYSLGLGVSCFIAGRLLERIDARWLMTGGSLLAGAAFLLASRTNSLMPLVACYVLIGAGCAFTGAVAMAVVAANWFPARRSFALGVAYFGVGFGMSTAPRLVTAVVAHMGWRWGMIAIALPLIFLVSPANFLFMRSSPNAQPVLPRRTARADLSGLSGLDLGPALLTMPFWLLALYSVLSSFGVGGVQVHTIPYLISTGYSPASASLVFGGQAILSAPGSLLLGYLADRFGCKWVLAASVFALAGGVILLLSIGQRWLGITGILGYVVLYGIDMATGPVQPMLFAEMLGMRRFSTFAGINLALRYGGMGLGPIFAGAVFDMTGSYVAAFEMGAAFIVLSAAMVAMVYPARGHDQVAVEPSAAAAS